MTVLYAYTLEVMGMLLVQIVRTLFGLRERLIIDKATLMIIFLETLQGSSLHLNTIKGKREKAPLVVKHDDLKAFQS